VLGLSHPDDEPQRTERPQVRKVRQGRHVPIESRHWPEPCRERRVAASLRRCSLMLMHTMTRTLYASPHLISCPDYGSNSAGAKAGRWCGSVNFLPILALWSLCLRPIEPRAKSHVFETFLGLRVITRCACNSGSGSQSW
jgi:hypothetical protein